VIDKAYEENAKANSRSHHTFMRTLKQFFFQHDYKKSGTILLSRIQGL